MALRQEQVVFVGTALLLGALGYNMYSQASKRGSGTGRAAGELEFQHYSAPRVAVVLPDERVMPLNRELFHPPRDTRPLPLLPLIEPPRTPLALLFPPSDPGPRTRSFGRLLRREFVQVELLDLFASQLDAEGDALGESTEELLQQLGAEGPGAHDNETPAETKARLDGYRRRFDWIQRGAGSLSFGRIANEQRFDLNTDPERAAEDLLFVEVVPETGEARFKSVGAEPIAIPRQQLSDFGLADTAANRLELKRASFRGDLGRVDFRAALQLADEALKLRLEAPRALEIAEEMFRLCIAYDPSDLPSQLGAISCLEAGFRFEEALQAYRQLETTFGIRAEVHVGLAQLDERFLSFNRARAGYLKAVRLEPNSWQAHLAFGEFLMRRGESAAALAELQAAQRFAPSAAELLRQRVQIREALGDALFAEGDLEQAADMYQSALAADEGSQRAKAGLLSIGLHGSSPEHAYVLDGESSGYELLLARGLLALGRAEYIEARDLLMQALEADPLRAQRPYAALSSLAYLTGNESEALGFIEAALEVEPRDAFALYWRGRLLTEQSDYEGAKASLLAALDVELDFEDALVGLGELAFRMGDFADADRFFGRALWLDGTRSEVHALAGMNLLRLGSLQEAQDAFERALSLEPENAHASCGVAWCAYLLGDSTKARVLLSNLDDARRALPEQDPWRLWAREQIARIDDHSEKVEWSDNFNRQSLINGWYAREGSGPLLAMHDGAAKIEGVFDKEGSTSIFREYRASDFVSMAIDLWIDPKTRARTSVFLSRERRRGLTNSVIGEVQVGRHADGSLQIRSVTTGREPATVDMQQSVPTAGWVRFSIERDGDEEGSHFTLSMDGIRLIEGLDVPSLKGANATLMLGVSVEGKSGQEVKLLIDEATVVYRDKSK